MTNRLIIMVDRLEFNEEAIKKIVNHVADLTSTDIIVESVEVEFTKHINTLYINCDVGKILISDFGCMTYFINGRFYGSSVKKEAIELLSEFKDLIVELD